LTLTARIAKRTRSQADDLLTSILRANEERLVDAVVALLADSGGQPPTEDQVVQALKSVGIEV
jgi:ribose 1,5-bisphosphokinase PhnN